MKASPSQKKPGLSHTAQGYLLDRNLMGFVRHKQGQRTRLMQHPYFSSMNIYLVATILAFVLYQLDSRYDLSEQASKVLNWAALKFNREAGSFIVH